MASDYDKILRDSFREPKQALLLQLVPAAITSITPLVPKLQAVLEREADTVAEVATETWERFIVHIEWQSSNDVRMAERMALYDLLLRHTYHMDVMGIVLYVGNDKLRMKDSLSFFGFHYTCKMLDVRLLNPQAFLLSADPGEVMFAVLAGQGSDTEREAVIRRIFSTLQQLYVNDPDTLQVKIKQLELLSLLRGETIQQFIIKEGQKMPVTIDITKDLRYKQGLGEGIEKGIEKGIHIGVEQSMEAAAEKMFNSGLDIALVQQITGLPLAKLEEILLRIIASKE